MKRLLLWVVAATAMVGIGCGGGSSSAPTTTTAVTISPTATQTVTPGGTVTFTATVNSTDTTTGTVTNITSTGVTWEVDGTTGGSTSTGTISTTGVFTAPSTINVAIAVTVSAVSVSDTSASGSTTVNLEPQPEISISPTSVTVAAGQSQTFTATVLSSVTNQAVNWLVNGQQNGNAALGTINAGVYTAPQVPPPGAQVTITAVLQADSTQTAQALATDTYGPASLINSYSFLIRGETTRGCFLRAGSFTADGKGNITAGIEDINGAGLPTPAAGGTSFTGTYAVGGDGRGTLLFHDGFGSNFGGVGNSKFTMAVVSANQAQVAESDVFASGSGEADFQSVAPPSATAFSGVYVFDFSGIGVSAEPLSIVGEFAAAANGAATVGGVDDINDNGSLTPANASLTFSYQLGGSGGRSTAILVDGSGTKSFSFYMLPTNRLRFIGLDSGPVIGGDAVAQQNGLVFNLGDLGGNVLANTTGINSSGPVATVASFSASGAGTLQPVTVLQNNSGTVTNQVATTGSTYRVAGNGRGMMALSTGQSYVFYLSASDQGVIQETDQVVSSTVSDGQLISLFNSPPPLTALNGSLALQWIGEGLSLGEQDATGQFVASVTPPGSSQFKSGTLDSNTANGSNPSAGFTPASNVSLTPATPYLLSTATGTINITVGSTNLQFAVFFTSQTSAVILRVDTSDKRSLSGIMAKQF